MPLTANLDLANNFTNIKQQIIERDIATVTYGSKPPKDVPLIPNRVGEIFFQLPETTPDRALRMWVSVLIYAPAGGISYEWHEIVANGGHDDDYARVTQENNFHEIAQTIQGRQILTWIDGGDQNPGDSGNRPEFDGQLYAAVKDITGPDGVVRPDLAVWMGKGNTWLPMVNEAIDVSKLAKLDGPNVFTDTVQMIGPAEDGRLIGGTRIKKDGAAPIADPDWRAKIEGEQTIWFNSKAEGGMQVTIWTAVSTTGNQVNDWKMVWSSKAGTIDPDNIAHLDQTNFFELPQRIGTGANAAYVVSSRRGPWGPHEAEHPDIMPFCVGDIYIEDWDEAGVAESRIWMATVASDAGSWHCVYDSTASDSALKAMLVLLEERLNIYEDKIETVEHNIGILARNIEEAGAEFDEHIDDYHLLSGLVDNLNTVSGQHETRIAALETGLTPDLTGLIERVSNAELSIAENASEIATNATDINTNVDEIATLKGRVATLEANEPPPGEDLMSMIQANAANIEDNNRDIGMHKILIDQHDRQIEKLIEDVAAGGGSGGGGESPDLTDLTHQVNTLEINVRENSANIITNQNSIESIGNEVDGVTTTANDAKIIAEQAKATVELIEDTVHKNTNDIAVIRTDVNGAVINADEAKTNAANALAKANEAIAASDEVVDDITTINNTLTEHGGHITNLMTDMTAVEHSVTEIEGKVNTNTGEIIEVKKEVVKIPELVSGLEATNTRITDALVRITTAETDINTVEADVAEINTDLNDITETLTGLSANMVTATDRITANEASIAATDGLVEGHQTELLNVAAELGDHETRIETLELGGGGATPDLTDLIAKVNTNTTNINEANLQIAENVTDIQSNNVRIKALEQGSYNVSKIYTAAVPMEDFHKHEVLVFNHELAMDNSLPIVDDTLDENGAIATGRIASGHFIPVFNISSNIVNLKTLRYTSQILDLRDMTYHDEFPMPTGASCLITGLLPNGNYGYMYLPMAAPADPDPGLPPELDEIEGRVTILETFQSDTEATIGQFPTVKTPHKYLVVNEEGTGYKLSAESVEDVQALAAFAEGAKNGNALINAKALGGDIGPVYTETVTIEQFCESNYISTSPVAGEVFYAYLGNIVPYNSTTLASNEVREGMLYYVANKGSGTTRLNAPTGHNIFTSTQAATEFDIVGETGVILMPSIYEKAGETKKMWTTIGIFHTNVKAGGGSSYDDTEVRGLITANTTKLDGYESGNVLMNIKSIGGQTRITANGMEQDATSAGNTLILTPGSGFNRSIKMPHIADHDVDPLPANHIREGMVMTVLNRGAGQARLEAQGSDRIDDNGTVDQYFQMESKQGVLLFPARYDAGTNRSQYIVVAKFKIDAFPGAGETYDDTEVRGLIETNETAIGVNTAGLVTANEAIATNTASIATVNTAIATANIDIETNTTNITANTANITTIETGIDAMAAEWTTKFNELETTATANTAASTANTAALVTANENIATNTAGIATNVTGLINANAAITTLTGRVDTADENAGNAIGTANALASRMNTAEASIETAETNITTLQNSMTDTGSDITAVSDRVTPLETDMILVKGQTTSLDTRIDVLEALPEHPSLPEMTGNGGKYLVINDAEDAYVASTFTNEQATEMLAFGEGCSTGNSLVNLKCQGADTALTSGEITQTYFSTGNVVMGTPAGPATNVVVCNMGVIQPFTSTTLAATDVREGCIITVANLGNGTMRLTPPSGCKIKSGTNENWETYDVKPGRTVTLFPAIYDSRAKKYIVLSNVGNAWAE